MCKTTGSSTKVLNAAKGGTGICDTGTETKKDQSISQKATPSARNSTETTAKPLDNSEIEYQPPVFDPPLPVDSLTAANLPYTILSATANTAHFAAVAPNTTACIITTETIADLPPGYVVVLVFDHVDPADLPPGHQDGKIYIVPSNHQPTP